MPTGRRKPSKTDQHRFVVYIERGDYLAFKEKLAAEGLTISGWTRKQVRAVLDAPKDKA